MLSKKELLDCIPKSIRKIKKMGDKIEIIHDDTNYAVRIYLTPAESQSYNNYLLKEGKNFECESGESKKGRYKRYKKTIKNSDGLESRMAILCVNGLNWTLGIKLTDKTIERIRSHWEVEMPAGKRNYINDLNRILKDFIQNELKPEILAVSSIINDNQVNNSRF